MNEWGIHVEWLYKGLSKVGLTEHTLDDYLASHVESNALFLQMDDYLKLFQWSALTLNDPHVGLKVATKVGLDDFGLLGVLGQYTATVADLLMALERYQKILMTGMAFSLHTENGVCEIRYHVNHEFNEGVRQDVELTIAVMVVNFHNMLGDSFKEHRINFTHTMAGKFSEYSEILGKKVYFSQPHNSFVIDESWLDLPISKSDPKLLKILQQQAEQLLIQLDIKPDFVTQVRLLITTRIGDERYNLEVLCQQLNVTSRTLRRRLKKYNLTYQFIREEIVLKLAKEALIKTDASVTELALRLGYSESSSFVRAFKRECGVSPLQYRNKNINYK